MRLHFPSPLHKVACAAGVAFLLFFQQGYRHYDAF
jgi:hypothetical protein